MKFFKENTYDIIRLFVNQIGITIFSFFLYTAVGAIQDDALTLKVQVVVSVFAILFYFSLLYTAAWDYGAKDKIRVDAGRATLNKFRGALMGFFANLLNFILSGITIIFMAFCVFEAGEWAQAPAAIFDMITRFVESMYLGLLQGVFVAFKDNLYLYHFMQAIGFFIMPVLSILSVHFGYSMGLKEKKIFPSAKKTKTNK